MQETMKRVAAGALGLLMAGSTLLAPSFATADLSSFANMKPSDTVIVVGANAITQDVVGAINIGGALAQHGATATVTGVSAAAGAVTGGVSLSTTSTPIYTYDNINVARTTIAKGDLPGVLDSGTVQDGSGTNYNYDQYIQLGAGAVTYVRPSSLSDPVVAVNMTYGQPTSTTAFYISTVTFNTPINVDDTTKNFGGKTIKLFGNSYTIGSTSTAAKLILFGSGNSATMSEGDTQTITVGGTSYTVKLIGVSDANTIVLQVGTDSRSLTKGNSYNIGGLDIYINDVFFFSKQGAVSSAKLSFGSSRLTLQNGVPVKTGTSDTQIDGTYVSITNSTGIAQLQVLVAAKDTTTNYIGSGSAFVDPVFGGFKVAFSGLNPDVTDAARDTVVFGTSGSDRVTATINDWNGNTKTIEFARDTTPGVADAATVPLLFQDGNSYKYHVVEGEAAPQYDYVITDAGDFSHLFQVQSFSGLGASGAKVTLKDVMSGTTYDINLNDQNFGAGSKVVDGQTIYANVTGGATPTVRLTWGASSGEAGPGSQVTVFPGIKLKKGSYAYLTGPDQLVNLSAAATVTLRMPASTNGAALTTSNGDVVAVANLTGSAFNITTIGGTATSSYNTNAAGYNVLVGRQYYNITYNGTYLDISMATGSSGAKVTQPAVMVMEEKDDRTQWNAIVVQAGDNSNGATVNTNTVSLTGPNSGGQSSTSSTSVTRYVDRYGTLLVTDNNAQGKATIYYPDNQAPASVYALSASVSIPAVGTSGVSGTGTVNQPSLAGGIAKVDSAVTSSDKTNKNVILVGGPAANALVAELAAANKTYDLNYWLANLQGKYVIQAVENAFAQGKTAIVVAGYAYQQTQTASLALATQALTGTNVTSA